VDVLCAAVHLTMRQFTGIRVCAEGGVDKPTIEHGDRQQYRPAWNRPQRQGPNQVLDGMR
jgi:hypothetical protein